MKLSNIAPGVALISALSACSAQTEKPRPKYGEVAAPGLATAIIERVADIRDEFVLGCILSLPVNRKQVNVCERDGKNSDSEMKECPPLGCTMGNCSEARTVIRAIDANPSHLKGITDKRTDFVQRAGGVDLSRWVCTNDIALGYENSLGKSFEPPIEVVVGGVNCVSTPEYDEKDSIRCIGQVE